MASLTSAALQEWLKLAPHNRRSPHYATRCPARPGLPEQTQISCYAALSNTRVCRPGQPHGTPGRRDCMQSANATKLDRKSG
jgi:hypothetical protein